MNVYANIQEALFRTLMAATPDYPIAWPNIAFSPDEGQTFLEVELEFKPTQRLTVGRNPWMQHRGRILIRAAVPAHLGEVEAMAIFDTIDQAFYPGQVVRAQDPQATPVRIVDCTPRDKYMQKTWTIRPIEVRWECEAQNTSEGE